MASLLLAKIPATFCQSPKAGELLGLWFRPGIVGFEGSGGTTTLLVYRRPYYHPLLQNHETGGTDGEASGPGLSESSSGYPSPGMISLAATS